MAYTSSGDFNLFWYVLSWSTYTTVNNKHHHLLNWMTVKGKCLDYYFMCQPCVTPSSVAYTHNTKLIHILIHHLADPHPHTPLGWSTYSYTTRLIHIQYIIEIQPDVMMVGWTQNNILLNYRNMAWWVERVSCGCGTEPDIIYH